MLCAQVVQLFDSWAHHLSPDQFAEFSLPYAERVITAVRAVHPSVPLIYHANGGEPRHVCSAPNLMHAHERWHRGRTISSPGVGNLQQHCMRFLCMSSTGCKDVTACAQRYTLQGGQAGADGREQHV